MKASMPGNGHMVRPVRILPEAIAGILGWLCLLAVLAGCSTLAGDKVQPGISQWSCDPAADEAMRAGDEETGLRLHQEFVSLHPDNPLALYHLGYAFGRSGNIEAEIAHYEKALLLGYDANAQLYFNMGMAYKELNQADQAMTVFEKAIEIDPNALDAMLELARLRQQAGDDEGARSLLQRAEELEPDNGFVREWLKALENGR
jgi:tetratricopeptide (TPR) repeat protein